MVDLPTLAERDSLAGEFALGVLSGEERARALRLLLSDAEFAAEVDAWQVRLAPLLDAAPEEHAPASLWPRIEARLDGDRGAAPVSLVSRQVQRWRTATVGMGAVAAALALYIGVQATHMPVPQSPDGAMIAQLSGAAPGDAAAMRMAARYEPTRGMLKVRADVMPKAGETAPELWVIPADGKPRSLGLLMKTGMTEVAIPESYRALIAEGATLAITIEPTEGAPHAAPSSTPVAAGQITVI